jgi:hypothetical protein
MPAYAMAHLHNPNINDEVLSTSSASRRRSIPTTGVSSSTAAIPRFSRERGPEPW